jgi:hypothetical protein
MRKNSAISFLESRIHNNLQAVEYYLEDNKNLRDTTNANFQSISELLTTNKELEEAILTISNSIMEKSIMKIFIWKSYGDIEVYDVSTLENIKELYTSIYDIVKDYGDDETEVVNDRLKSRLEDVEWLTKQEVAYIRAINSLLEISGMGNGDNDCFERGTGFSELNLYKESK